MKLKLYDKQIRKVLKDYLREVHDERFYTIRDELRISEGKVVADLAIVKDDHLLGFEIKSDRDNLKRLPNQVSFYNYNFKEIYLVIVESHLLKALEIIPNWWGVILVINDGVNITLKDYRKCSPNLEQTSYSLLRFLKNRELQDLHRFLGLKNYSNKPRKELILNLLEKIHPEVLNKLSCLKLNVRFGKTTFNSYLK